MIFVHFKQVKFVTIGQCVTLYYVYDIIQKTILFSMTKHIE